MTRSITCGSFKCEHTTATLMLDPNGYHVSLSYSNFDYPFPVLTEHDMWVIEKKINLDRKKRGEK